jgi:hypothetical protein
MADVKWGDIPDTEVENADNPAKKRKRNEHGEVIAYD